MSLFHSFRLHHFCSPLFGFFGLIQGFVEFDEDLDGLPRVWVSVTEFEVHIGPKHVYSSVIA